MSRLEIEASLRSNTGKGSARQARLKGLIPAELYGNKKENLHLTIVPKLLQRMLVKGRGASELIDLKVGSENIPVLIKDWQADPIKRNLTHVDFYRVDLSKKVVVHIPINLTGKAAGLAEGGVLELITRQIEIRCLPTNIPEFIEVDVTPLNIGESIHASDLKLEGIELVSNKSTTLVTLVAPSKEEVAASPAEGAAAAEPELVKEKGGEKKEEAAAGAKEKK